MKILIADDQAEVRSALRILLEQETTPGAISEAEDIDKLFSIAEREQPGLILLDWELSGKAMAGRMPALRRCAEGAKIIAMSVRPEAARSAAEAGADAFVSKGDNSDKLLRAIRALED
jgi:DNA-binding NarL/FixJ family response regulator